MRLRIASTVSGGERFVELPSVAGALQVGRHKTSDVVLSDSSVSRVHARLTMNRGCLSVEDLGSSGGTYVNDVRVSGSVPVNPGDCLRIGTFRLDLEDEEPCTRTQTFESECPAPRQESPARRPVETPHAPPPAKAKAPPSDDFDAMFKDAMLLCTDEMMALKARIHALVLSQVDPLGTSANKVNDEALSAQAEECLDRVLRELRHELPDGIPEGVVKQALMDELTGYGPITPMLRRPEISEIMINGPDRIFVECRGKLRETGVRFFNEKHLIQIIQRIVEPLGRHVDDASPMVDARLPDGSRVNAVVPPPCA